MTHLLTHGVQDGGCRYTVEMQSCTMCLYGERGVSRMTHTIINIITVAALALIGMASIAITLAVITWEEWDE